MRNLVLFIFFLTTLSCNDNMKQFQALAESDDVHVLVLDASETSDFKENVQYVQNRRVLKDFNLEGSQKKAFTQAFLKKENYETSLRKCRFEPVYALEVDGKILATFDVEYCPMLAYKDENDSPRLIGIATDNTIKQTIEAIMKE